MSYAELLSKYIKNSGMTLEEISKSCSTYGLDIHPTYISKLRLGKRPAPSDDVTRALARVLSADPDGLIFAGYMESAPNDVKELLQAVGPDKLDDELIEAIPYAKQYIKDNKRVFKQSLIEYETEQKVNFKNVDEVLKYHIGLLPVGLKFQIILLKELDTENPEPKDASFSYLFFTHVIRDAYVKKAMREIYPIDETKTNVETKSYEPSMFSVDDVSPEQQEFLKWVEENLEGTFFYDFDKSPEDAKKYMMETLRMVWEREKGRKPGQKQGNDTD